MSEPTRWQRFVGRLVDVLSRWLPQECGVLARSGDVYCTLPDGHDGPHGWAEQGEQG